MRSKDRSQPAVPPPTSAGLTALSDEELLQVVFRRSEAAWRELLRRFRPLLIHCACKAAYRQGAHLADEDIDEILGELCWGLLRGDMHKLRAWQPARSKLSSWLGLLAAHAASDHLRAARRRPRHDDLEGHALERVACAPTALEDLLDRERWRYLLTLMAGFSAKDRRFVELYFTRGLEAEEVARRMQISVKTVYSKRHKLQLKLEAMAAADPHAPSRGDQRPAPRQPHRPRRYGIAA